jgi:single-strand DNA-binding protein
MMNKFIAIGRMTKEAEIKSYQTQKGLSSMARFTLAVTRDREHTDFIPCTAFGKAAEIIEKYTEKGSQIGIEGSVKQNTWQTQSGENRSSLGVVVQSVNLLSQKKQPNQEEQESQTTISHDEYDMMSDDLPF